MLRPFTAAVVMVAGIGTLREAGSERVRECLDQDPNCYAWVAYNHSECTGRETLQSRYCAKSCLFCGDHIPKRYDLRRVPENLKSIAFLLGRWRSEFGGKAFFPTMPKFTYGEEVDFSLSNQLEFDALNYTAFAWNHNDQTELHTELGYITVRNGTNSVSMNTVMSNGFMTIEEGIEEDNFIRLRLRRVARIRFSRDLPIRRTLRTWTLLDPTHLEARFSMSTITHPMTEHTSIIYEKIFP